MKSEKGITLTSLIIYVIAMLITVTIITIITSYFYKNVEVTTDEYDFYGEFTKFQSYFVQEANLETNKIIEISNEAVQPFIALTSGNQYTYIRENKSIYKNCVKIASHIDNCVFSLDSQNGVEKGIQNGKEVVVVTITINGETRTMKFAIKNW